MDRKKRSENRLFSWLTETKEQIGHHTYMALSGNVFVGWTWHYNTMSSALISCLRCCGFRTRFLSGAKKERVYACVCIYTLIGKMRFEDCNSICDKFFFKMNYRRSSFF